jgi:hypothetical protein
MATSRVIFNEVTSDEINNTVTSSNYTYAMATSLVIFDDMSAIISIFFKILTNM